MATVIGRIPCTWNYSAGWQVEPADQFLVEQLQANLLQLPQGGVPLEVTVALKKRHRSDGQNRLMWALLHRIALAMSGDRPGDIAAEHVYLDELEQCGVRVDYLELPVPAVPMLHNAYRVVRIVELLADNRCVVRATLGSSSFDTAQMHGFIERLFDRLAELGVDNDPEVTSLYREWAHG